MPRTVRTAWRRRLLLLLMLAATLASGLIAVTMPTAQAATPALRWSLQLSGERSASHLMTLPDGSIKVGLGNASPLYNVGSDGKLSSYVPNTPSVVVPNTSSATSAVDPRGKVYVATSSTDGKQFYVIAYQGSTEAWRYTLPCQADTLRRGADGNIYVVASGAATSAPCATPRLIGISTSTNSPAEVSNRDLGQGTTVPAGGLAPYTNGLAVQTANGIQFYDYQTGAARVVPASLVRDQTGDFAATTDGRAIVVGAADTGTQALCNSTYTSGGVSAISANGAVWSHALPACSTVYTARPTPSGGAVVHYGVRDTVTGNTSYYLLSLKGDGSQSWQTPLPQTDPQDSQIAYTGDSYQVDAKGQVLLQRGYMQYSRSSGDRWPGIRLMLLSTSGLVLSEHNFAGDPSDSSDGGYGYQQRNGAPAISDGVAYVLAVRCSPWQNCASDMSLHAVNVPGVNLDYPRGALLGQTPPTARLRNYVALGDSYSSGEGVEPFEAGTDTKQNDEVYNVCHRSASSYARLLAGDASLSLSIQGFKACSGAKMAQITGRWPEKGPDNKDGRNLNEAPQLDAVKSDTDVVTISIGGNDADFGGLATRCLLLDCSSYRRTYLAKAAALDAQLQSTYRAILDKAPNAKLYVVGYPQLLSATRQCTTTNTTMRMLNALPKQVRVMLARDAGFSQTEIDRIANARINAVVEFNSAEQQLMRDFATSIDARVQAAVTSVGRSYTGRITYIDPTGAKSPFAGHELCAADSYFNSVDVMNPEYSFHPNAKGAAAYQRLIAPYLAKS